MNTEIALLDANNKEIDWERISTCVLHWKIAVGLVCPNNCDSLSEEELAEKDVLLLLSRSRFMVSDREKYKTVCAEALVPFVFVSSSEDIKNAVERIDEIWNAKTHVTHHNS